jgi:hypothetical protein
MQGFGDKGHLLRSAKRNTTPGICWRESAINQEVQKKSGRKHASF